MEALIMYIILVLTTSPLALIVSNQISFVNMMKDNKDQMYSKKTWLETCFTLTAQGSSWVKLLNIFTQGERLDRVKMLFYVRVE